MLGIPRPTLDRRRLLLHHDLVLLLQNMFCVGLLFIVFANDVRAFILPGDTCTSRPARAQTIAHFRHEQVSDDIPPSPTMHDVEGIICREVSIEVDSIGPVTILEATAESQEVLVDAACGLEDEESDDSKVQLEAGDPYGSVLWPAASAVANHLMTLDQEDREKQTLLELGTGTGLVALAAARAGYCNIIASDYESVPLRLLEYTAAKLNDEDDLTSRITTTKLDICDFDTPLPDADLVVAADIMYEPATGRATAKRTVEALKRGSRVVIGCSPGRPGRPAFLEELKQLMPGVEAEFVDAQGTTCSGPRHELICGKGSTSVSDKPKMLLVKVMDLDPDCISSNKPMRR